MRRTATVGLLPIYRTANHLKIENHQPVLRKTKGMALDKPHHIRARLGGGTHLRKVGQAVLDAMPNRATAFAVKTVAK